MAPSLTPLVYLSDYKGNFTSYQNAVYEHFKADLISSKAFFQGNTISLRRNPEFQGREYSFWHITSGGNVEDERLPDLRRYERIRWIRPIIENAEDSAIKQWENKRSGEPRICLWLEEEDYLVILAPRKNYILLLTAYMTDRDETRRKIRKEYTQSLKG